MFLFKKHLDRRTFLRGVGATVALPLLDAMIPARALLASMSARPVQRLAFVYFPHGAVMAEWMRVGNRQPATGSLTTEETGGRADSEPPGRILEPLAPFRDRLTVIGGIENRSAYGPVHAITPGTWLSGIHPGSGPPSLLERSELRRVHRSAKGAKVDNRQTATGRRHATGGIGQTATGSDSDGATADQLAADYFGRETALPSLSLAAEEPVKIGAGIWEGQ